MAQEQDNRNRNHNNVTVTMSNNMSQHKYDVCASGASRP